jgi:hypothetical protein
VKTDNPAVFDSKSLPKGDSFIEGGTMGLYYYCSKIISPLRFGLGIQFSGQRAEEKILSLISLKGNALWSGLWQINAPKAK